MPKEKFIFLCLITLTFLIGIASAENQTEISNTDISVELKGISLYNFFPTETKVGDVQFSIQIKNEGNETINNIIALVSGRGFSSYDIVPIDSLSPGERSYIIAYGNLRESGNITLTLRIDRKIFYKNITVTDPNERVLSNAEEEQKKLENISQQIEELKTEYASLELEISEKKDQDYDVSSIKLDDLKKFLRDAETSVFSKNLNGAISNLRLAEEEYNYQKNKRDTARTVPTINKIKDYAIIFSAIAGSILAFFAIYELLIRKSMNLARFGKNVAVKVIKKKPVA